MRCAARKRRWIFFESWSQVQAGASERWRETEQNSRENGSGRGKGKDAQIQMRCQMRRPQAPARHKRDKRLYAPVREKDSGDSSCDRENQAFGEQLPRDSCAPGTQS